MLVLTTFDLDEYVYAAMRAGASGYLLKDTPARELVPAVRVIAQGDALLSPSVTKRLIEEFARRAEPERGGGDGFLGQEFEGRLLTKFGVRDRVQAVVLAYETGLVRPGVPAKRNLPSE